MKRLFLLTLLLICSTLSTALNDTLYIIRDSISVVGFDYMQSVFSEVDTMQPRNKHLVAAINEDIELTIINLDNLNHSFTVNNIIDQEILAGSVIDVSFSIPEQGTYRYYSKSAYGSLIGASGIIQVGYENEISYFWNLHDINVDLTYSISNQVIDEIPLDYQPNLFFINGYSFPHTLNDETGYVTQSIGDEIYISIVNSGNMEHVLHFHGYHIEIMDVTYNTKQLGWIKDTFPLLKKEAMTIKLVPHQPGIYPVHDHNLIAVTNAGFYPGGMITQLNISE